VGQDWQELPPALKRGTIVALTWEAIFSDRTGLLIQQASDVGRWMGQNKEKRIIDAIVDENTGAKSAAAGGHRYHWRGSSYATYQTSASSAPYYANVVTSNAFVDWTDLQGAELAFMAIKHPYTNEPMSFQPTAIVVVPTLRYVADYVMSMSALHYAVGGYATSGNLSTLITQAPTGRYRVLSSQLLADQMATDTDWYLADLKRAVGYKTCRPLTVEQAPAGHPDAFNRDVMQQWKVSEIGAACVLEPRAIVESRA
jgi:hypothetical protein